MNDETAGLETAKDAEPSAVDFYLDPICPWAYQASVWIREVREATGLEIGWRFFSLEEINRPEGRPHPWERPWAWSFSQMRVGAYLRRESQDAVDRWYAAVGSAFFVFGVPTQHREIHTEVLVEAGFDPGVVAAALDDPSTADEVRADHDSAVTIGGFGVPILAFADGTNLFGPSIAPGPTGDDAVRLWKLVLGWKDFPNLHEMQRPKAPADWERIGTLFAPYLQAREWKTIQNPAP
mgnify:CR=1 FL=1